MLGCAAGPPSDNRDMSSLRRRSLPVVLVCSLLAVVPLLAFKDFVMPHAENAATYSSKDAHSDEKITIAIDLYNTAPKDEIFGTHYVQEGILPVFLVITQRR